MNERVGRTFQFNLIGNCIEIYVIYMAIVMEMKSFRSVLYPFNKRKITNQSIRAIFNRFAIW